ncbi:hypothetical protein AB1K91_05100 [Terribacillus sp. 179-K 1B1 HS]|uniref:hypothetical protein n=1 Tax=Terribacillus sp. 179-K 1B1 HS TaxID=3142388 RepID=UPI0039A0F69C
MEAPKKNFVFVQKDTGKFDLLHPEDESAAFRFMFPDEKQSLEVRELGLRTFFNIPCEKDYTSESDTPIETLEEIIDVHRGYLYSGSLKDAEKLLEYLQSIEEEQEGMRHQYNVDYAEYMVETWTAQLNSLKAQTV